MLNNSEKKFSLGFKNTYLCVRLFLEAVKEPEEWML